FSPDGKYLLSKDKKNNVILWDAIEGIELYAFEEITSTTFNWSSNKIALQKKDRLNIFDIATKNIVTSVSVPPNAQAIEFNPQNNLIAFASETSNNNLEVYLWNMDTQSIPQKLPLSIEPGTIQEIKFDETGRTLAVATSRGISTWDFVQKKGRS